eukprot:gb/GEZN01002952.1/.p1 GENE.gb/GEZN01002952.1/~~gb/GEZN01002952.1/.p1  ORF type:complete len:690 (-),score=125.67 gb/GEZN01002952.1/:246-2294(-)
MASSPEVVSSPVQNCPNCKVYVGGTEGRHCRDCGFRLPKVDRAQQRPDEGKNEDFELSLKEMTEAEDMFKSFAGGDENISLKELKLMMHKLSHNTPEAEVVTMFQEADVDSSGGIDFSEFLKMLQKCKQQEEKGKDMGAARSRFGSAVAKAKLEQKTSKTLDPEELLKLHMEKPIPEEPFEGAGAKVGTEVWRIEKFHTRPWPLELYGFFFSGDAYLVMQTRNKPKSQALEWDIHFWLGKKCTQDEQGTAAYKTVELDDRLGGEPVQHREVQGHESKEFLAIFPRLQYLNGGIDSGFTRVSELEDEYPARMYHIKGKRMVEVPLHCDSLNSGDVFLMDLGEIIYVWHGDASSVTERRKALEVGIGYQTERMLVNQATKIIVFEEKDDTPATRSFFQILGGKTSIASAKPDEQVEKYNPRLFRLSDEGGSLSFTRISQDKPLSLSLLDTTDVFILDLPEELFIWVGEGASKEEKLGAMKFATDYLKQENRPDYISVTRVRQGKESPAFLAALSPANQQVSLGPVRLWTPPPNHEIKKGKVDQVTFQDLAAVEFGREHVAQTEDGWLVLGYEDKSKIVRLLSTGITLEALRSTLQPNQLCYVLVSVMLPPPGAGALPRKNVVFFTFLGPAVKAMVRGRINSHLIGVQKALGNFTHELQVLSSEKLTKENVLACIKPGAGKKMIQ